MNLSMDLPPLVGELKKPIIYWYQTELEVVARIMLHDVEDYFLRVTVDSLEFSTTSVGVDYFVYLHLFGAVVAEDSSHNTTGREVTIHLPKVHRWTDWPRLLFSQIKSPQIFVDVDRLAAVRKPKNELLNWSVTGFAEYKKRNQIYRIMPDVPSSEDEDSADDQYNMLFDD